MSLFINSHHFRYVTEDNMYLIYGRLGRNSAVSNEWSFSHILNISKKERKDFNSFFFFFYLHIYLFILCICF